MAGTSKSVKKSKVVVLTLSPEQLSRFGLTTSSDNAIKSEKATPSGIQESSEDKSSEDNATPIPQNGVGQDTDAAATAGQQGETKKKRPPPNPNARKRAPPAIDPDAPMRDRSRPGPKKRSRGAAAGETVESKEAKTNASAAANAHKLGPKANTGAINAGLRALDRSGRPCRRWEKKGLQLKSFTGSSWHMPTWRGSQRPNLNADGEVQSDSSSEVKPLDASGVASEKSASAMDVGETTLMNGIESSPAPPVAA